MVFASGLCLCAVSDKVAIAEFCKCLCGVSAISKESALVAVCTTGETCVDV